MSEPRADASSMNVTGEAAFAVGTVTLPEVFVPGKIGVVTVTYGSAKVLPDFLRSLDQQTYRNFMLIAVDNQSQDNTLEQLRAYRGCELEMVANEQNLGVAAGNNQGIRASLDAGCEYVMLLNNDVVFGPELFQQLIDGMHTHDCRMTTPLIHYYDRPDVIWCAGGYYIPWLGYRCLHYGEGVPDRGQFAIARSVAYTPTCCVLIHRGVFEAVGLMDENYFVYFDDTDFMLRAWKARQTLFYLPHARLLHKVSSLTGTRSDRPSAYVYRNLAYYLRKHLGERRAWIYSQLYLSIFFLKRLFRHDSEITYRIKRDAFKCGRSYPA